MAAKTILVVDDEALHRWAIRKQLSSWGYTVLEADSRRAALEAYTSATPDAVLLDLRLGTESGLDVLREIKSLDPDAAIFMVTAHGDLEDAVNGFRLGLTDFFRKPIDFTALRVALRYRVETRRLREVAERSRQVVQRESRIVGSSSALKTAQHVLARVAASNASLVLLQGESGTGKDLFAQELHDCSARRDEPFIPVNCASLPEALLESELFGHERGAFTDAHTMKRGLFELAAGGTLYLDEVGELKLPLQAKLLRAIETLAFRRVGGVQDIDVDARLVAASNRDLARAVSEGQFRADLYYRLAVVQITLPPLRDRREDIPAVAQHLMRQVSARLGRTPPSLTPDALDALCRHEWPGNVRELRNTIERALILEDGETFTAAQLFGGAARTAAPSSGVTEPGVFVLPPEGISLDAVEAGFVRQAMDLARGNQSQAARLLGIGRDALRYKLKKFQLAAAADDEQEAAAADTVGATVDE
ncbi:MAG TPA: sigma-54 dependent transcriptional regulator [Vicinamibacterales bacterium]|nr:sigma-54 dependent transcriptional regulator [Vicinamibacterales bacterium]